MATPRIEQAHERRVQKIATDAAAAIAADSPFEEEVVVTVEELPPTGDRATRSTEAVPNAAQLLVSRQVVDSAAEIANAGIEYVQLAVAEHLQFAGRLAGALVGSSPQSSRKAA